MHVSVAAGGKDVRQEPKTVKCRRIAAIVTQPTEKTDTEQGKSA